jgi:hypothetical protein
MGPKIKKMGWGEQGRTGRGEGKMRKKRIINNGNKQLKSEKLYV